LPNYGENIFKVLNIISCTINSFFIVAAGQYYYYL